MTAIKYADNLLLVRSIQRELRQAIKPKSESAQTIKDDASVQHIFNVLRENQTTEGHFCRSQNHYRYFAETYLTYLRSSRLQDELTQKYFNKGELSVRDSAHLVGLKLPKMKTK